MHADALCRDQHLLKLPQPPGNPGGFFILRVPAAFSARPPIYIMKLVTLERPLFKGATARPAKLIDI